jgi:hypothetical protein
MIESAAALGGFGGSQRRSPSYERLEFSVKCGSLVGGCRRRRSAVCRLDLAECSLEVECRLLLASGDDVLLLPSSSELLAFNEIASLFYGQG